MQKQKREHPKEKTKLHPRNKNRERYNFKGLISSCPELNPFVKLNEYNDESIDFSNPDAVKMLNKSLLMHFYGISYWDIPQNYLCPPIPGRADYIHHIADLLGSCNHGIVPTGTQIRCLDIGVGANCIYPIIGNSEYSWSFAGTDIDPISIAAASKIVELNPNLKDNIELRFQSNPKDIFTGIIHAKECFDITICNPPFHASLSEAHAGTNRKLKNLNNKKTIKTTLNFGGKNNELWCDGGEEKFVKNMIHQSKQFAKSCFWFSSLISKQANLKSAYNELKKVEAVDVKTLPMGQGNKISRIVVWTFLSKYEQENWANEKWKAFL